MNNIIRYIILARAHATQLDMALEEITSTAEPYGAIYQLRKKMSALNTELQNELERLEHIYAPTSRTQ